MTKKRSYPIHRRPPIAHNVDGHTRGGHKVDGYSRGSGTRTYPIDRSQGNAEAFVVTMTYKDGFSEKVNVIAPKGDYKKAIAEALEEKTHRGKPVEVNILDPSLGEVIGFLRKGVGTGLKYVQKGVVKAKPHVVSGVKRGARGLGRGLVSAGKGIRGSVATSMQNREAKRLVRHSYSDDPGVSALARAKLKKKYPEVYDNCDFSRRVKPKTTTKKAKKKRKSITEILLGSKKKRKTKKKKKKKKKSKGKTITIHVD